MLPLEHFTSTLLKAQALLDKQALPYHLTGGAATVAYGEMRMTADLDYVIHRDQLSHQLSAFLKSANDANYYFAEDTIRDAVAAGRQFQLFDRGAGTKLDFYPRELVPGELSRSVLREILPGLKMPVVSRPDLIVAKLIWISKGSHKSRRDVRELIARAPADEVAVIREHAAAHQLSNLLHEVLSEPDEPIE